MVEGYGGLDAVRNMGPKGQRRRHQSQQVASVGKTDND